MKFVYLFLATIMYIILIFYIKDYKTEMENIFDKKNNFENYLLLPFLVYTKNHYCILNFLSNSKIKLSIKNMYGNKNFLFYELKFIAKKIMYIYYSLIFGFLFSGLSENDYVIFIFLIFSLFLNFYMNVSHLIIYENEKRKLKNEVPEFLIRLQMLLVAGITLRDSIKYIVENTNTNFSKKISIVLKNINNGKSEEEAYNDFLSQNEDTLVRKSINIIVQNIKNGGDEIFISLEQLIKESIEIRKNEYIVKTQKANQKLLIPNLMIFLGIMLMVIIPSILDM